SAFQELTQRLGLPLPTYELLGEEGPPHVRRFTVRVLVDGIPRGEGTGSRKADAEQAAAAIALNSPFTP
ncbi:MAG: ribonuclease III, partial [Chloroflexi bacterium]|nr:ribonuclease III [Chloroflexota bacterium]